MIGIMGFIIYPLLDYLYYKFITHSNFVYNVQDYIIREEGLEKWSIVITPWAN